MNSSRWTIDDGWQCCVKCEVCDKIFWTGHFQTEEQASRSADAIYAKHKIEEHDDVTDIPLKQLMEYAYGKATNGDKVMKLKEYIQSLDKLAKENPEANDYDVVYSRDDEGNGFQKVFYSPTVGHFNGYDFESQDTTEGNKNAVCIN